MFRKNIVCPYPSKLKLSRKLRSGRLLFLFHPKQFVALHFTDGQHAAESSREES